MDRLPASHAAVFRSAAAILSPAGAWASLIVFIFHRVLPQSDPVFPDIPHARDFECQMDLLSSLFHVLPLSEAAERLQARALPARAACITFDDGYADNLEIAAPILASRGLTATFFITTGFLDGGCMWNDSIIESIRSVRGTLDLRDVGLDIYGLESPVAQRRAIDDILGRLKYLDPQRRLQQVQAIVARAQAPLPSDLMMTRGQVRSLAAMGMEIGAHSVSHPILSRVDPKSAHDEIVGSKEQLESIIGKRVLSFAYPNGRPSVDYDAAHVAMVRDAGFTSAVTTAWGRANKSTSPHEIPRVAPWDNSARRYALRLLKCYLQRPLT